VNQLINVSDLKKAISIDAPIHVWAKPSSGLPGFFLYVNINGSEMVLSTYMSTHPRHFKRSDALLKEAANIGLNKVTFIDLIKEDH